jgi:uncharacterized protein (TIGR02722 family)
LKRIFVAVLVVSLLAACGGQRKVTRLDVNETVDLSGKWNDTDSRLVAEEMISDCLSRVWITDFAAAKGRKPVVIVGNIRNLSNEHINTETFATDFERELINSGKVRFVAAKDQREELRDERRDQQKYSSEETFKKFGKEVGADFMLLGTISTISDQIEGKRVQFYQTDLELINIETNEKVWIGTKKIKKEVEQKNLKW